MCRDRICLLRKGLLKITEGSKRLCALLRANHSWSCVGNMQNSRNCWNNRESQRVHAHTVQREVRNTKFWGFHCSINIWNVYSFMLPRKLIFYINISQVIRISLLTLWKIREDFNIHIIITPFLFNAVSPFTVYICTFFESQ